MRKWIRIKKSIGLFQGFKLSEIALYIALWLCLLLYVFFLSVHTVKAQTAIPVGGGSYAAFPPAGLSAQTNTFIAATGINVADTNTRPIPSNDWWTYVLQNNLGGNLWAYPAVISTASYGFQLYAPDNSNWNGGDMGLGLPIKIRGIGFNASRQIAKDWSDWMVVLNLTSGTTRMDITIGHGLPIVWTETSGVTPQLDFSKNAVSFFNDAGAAVTMPQTTDHVGIAFGGKFYAVFVPDNTVLSLKDSLLTATYANGTGGFIAIAVLPASAGLAEMAKNAFAIPRKTTVSWNYRPLDGKIDVGWKLNTQNLKGQSNLNVVQGFIPHHYKRSTMNFALNTMEYGVLNGKMKCAVGTSFGFTYDFNGVPATLPVPKVQNIPNPYNPAVMDQMVNNYAGKTNYRADTYYGGKDLVSYAQHAFIAKSIGNSNYAALKNMGQTALNDWLTYTPGEGSKYFARYDKWGAMVGFNPSFGSETFTDNHFHYGYFTYASALMGIMDPAWLDKYGPMAKLVAKQYANWDRTDKQFPFLRTFDPWTGHSWAGGTSSPNGNNQESTSESMQGWAGVFLLGSVTNDVAMRDAGAFGYLSESRATMEYWFDWDHTNFPVSYGHSMTSRVFAGGLSYGTWFGGDPLYVHAIQYLPWAPFMNYLVQDTAYARSEFNALMKEKNNVEIASFGSDWSNVVLSFAQMFDPGFVAKKMDYYYNSPVTTNTDTSRYASMHDYAPVPTDTRFTGALTYYFTHANRTLGAIQWNYHVSLPGSCTYFNPATGLYSSVIYNPSKTAQMADVYKGATLMGSYMVPAQTSVTFTMPNPITSIGINKPYKSVALGSSVQLTAKGFDQFGGIYPVSGVLWSVSGGGTIDANGLFTASSNVYPVIVTAKVNGFTATDTLRSGSPSVLASIALSPAFVSMTVNGTQQFTATAKDQFGDPYVLTGAVWTVSNSGVIDANGLFSGGAAAGIFEVRLTRGNVVATALVAVKATPVQNLALNKPATASSSNGANNAAAGVDGNMATRWESAAADNQTFSVDLQNAYELTRIVIVWEAAYGKSYDIQVSPDGIAYTTIYSQAAGSGKTEDFAVNGTAHFVRVKCNTRATNYGFSFFELQVYGYPAASTVVATNISITPSDVTVTSGNTNQFNAYGFDAGYNSAVVSGGTWSVSGGGTISSAGLFSATTVGGPFSVSYVSGAVKGTSAFSVVSGTVDCYGVTGGTAYYDACGKCAGGTTGIAAQPDASKCLTTALVNKNVDALKISAYPNPFDASFILNIGGADCFDILVTDVNGREVYKAAFHDTVELKLGLEFNPGMYFIRVSRTHESNYFKMVKY